MGSCCSGLTKEETRDLAHHRVALRALPLSNSDFAALYQYFKRMDRDHDGIVRTADFLNAIDLERTAFALRTFAIMDSLHTGTLTFREFVVAVWNYCTFEENSIYLFAFDLYDVGNTGVIEHSELEIMLKEVYGDSPNLKLELDRLKKHSSKFHDGVTPDKFADYVRQHPNMLFPVFTMQRALREHVLGNRFWDRATKERREAKTHWRSAIQNISKSEPGPQVVMSTSPVSSPRRPSWRSSRKAGLLPPGKYSASQRMSTSRKINPEDAGTAMLDSTGTIKLGDVPRKSRTSRSSVGSSRRLHPKSPGHGRRSRPTSPAHPRLNAKSGHVEVDALDSPASWMETPMIDSVSSSHSRGRISRTSNSSAGTAAAAAAAAAAGTGIAMARKSRTSHNSQLSANEAALLVTGTLAERKMAAELLGSGSLSDRKLASELLATGGSHRSDASFRSEGSHRGRSGLPRPARKSAGTTPTDGPDTTGPLMWTPTEMTPTRPVSMSNLKDAHSKDKKHQHVRTGSGSHLEPRGRSRSPAGDRMARHKRDSSASRSRSPNTSARSTSPFGFQHGKLSRPGSGRSSRPGSGRSSRPGSAKKHHRTGSERSVGSRHSAGRVESRLPY